MYNTPMSIKPEWIERKNRCFPSLKDPALCTSKNGVNSRTKEVKTVAEAKEIWIGKRFAISIFSKNLSPQEYAWALHGLQISDHEKDAMVDYLLTCPNEALRNALMRSYAKDYLRSDSV